jgi:hypothetical protein
VNIKILQCYGIKEHTETEELQQPDTIIKNKKVKTCILVNVAIPTDRNVTPKEAKKKIKHQSLWIEIQRKWNLKYKIIPVITGATAVVTKCLKKNWEIVTGKHSIDSLLKQLYLQHIKRTVPQYET